MSYLSPEIKTFGGLFLQKNSFTVPDGAMEIANNVVIQNDDIIIRTRGYYTYDDTSVIPAFPNNLFNFNETLVCACEDRIIYYTDSGSSPNLIGIVNPLTSDTNVVVEITPPRVSRSSQSNGNLYFTTDNGVLKIQDLDSALPSDNYIYRTGAPPGLDISAMYVVGLSSNFFTQGNQLGYRVLFGYNDANDNLILGAPSDIVTINNTAVTVVSYTSAGAGPWVITVTSIAHGLTTGMYLVFYAGSSANANGTYQINVTGVDTFTYTESLGDPTPAGNVSYGYAMPIRLEFTVPTEISANRQWFYQIYRSTKQLLPGGISTDFRLLDQGYLTAAQLASRIVFFTDSFSESILGAELYTNENSREGEQQANARPPLCEDLAIFQGYSIYANAIPRNSIDFAIIDSQDLTVNDFIEVKVDSTTRRYLARTGYGNKTTRGLVSGVNLLVTTPAPHGYADFAATGNVTTLYISNPEGGALTEGIYYLIWVSVTTFNLSTTVPVPGPPPPLVPSGTITALLFEGVQQDTSYMFQLDITSLTSIRLRETGQGIVKAINRDPLSLVYAQYTSTLSQFPGKMRLTAKEFTGIIYLRANTIAVGLGFFPALPDSFASGIQVGSTTDTLPNGFFISKFNEPEAVPIVNFNYVGSKNYPILRVHALKYSLIVIKEDGVWRVTGDNPGNFSTTLLDGTVKCLASNTSCVINNQVIFLSNQGVALVTESAVQIISRKIEDVIQSILTRDDIEEQSSGVSYEIDRLYLMTTIDANDTSNKIVYSYNVLNDTWTTTDFIFNQAVVGPSNILYQITKFQDPLIDPTIISKERKNNNRYDYVTEHYDISVVISSNDPVNNYFFANIDSLFYDPQVGDIIVKYDVLSDSELVNIITSVKLAGANNFDVTFLTESNLDAGDTEIIYQAYTIDIQTSPYTGGLVGRSKQFAQTQIHFRDKTCTELDLTFSNDSFETLIPVEWKQINPTTQPIDLPRNTSPSNICRIYVPRSIQRSTYIQINASNTIGGDRLDIQALAYSVRTYAERVSK